ncbi:hypothetical protein AEAC466_13395 [Asticcacaulis sp. AC466]|uniref:hypothetical protein n=1 Tax=Asticcacaulis sp. AC466 TaxID=1282362 RepID=UPI0003C3E4A7|nr:hypothetical protein [Asticcacaulis sp. AC466]ESQ83241.1 hypothetical protein AEAC466_13395 [Asticcacaulis sp. AC466]
MTSPRRAYTLTELDRAQTLYDLTFPPDLIAYLSNDHWLETYDWRTDNPTLRGMLDWPYDGLIFDVEQNALWPTSWGERPDTPQERAEALKALVTAAPKLIPLFGHRYLPAEPNSVGNPVFSIYQSDIIIYGTDLADYVARELGEQPNKALPNTARRIRFWSDLVDQNNEP